jgi:putative sugar O-methyltransferase
MKLFNKIKRKLVTLWHKHGKVEKVVEQNSKELEALKLKIKNIIDTEPLGTSSWENNRRALRSDILNKDINDFINWEIIQKTMFFEAPEVEYKKVVQNKELVKTIYESQLGNPKPYFLNKKTSGNLVHHAYSLSYFLDLSSLKNINCVIEIGGGYGSMCRLFRNMQYKNKYIIFDLPEFSALQEFYLECIDRNYLNNTIFTGDENQLKSKCTAGNLLIATWSLSEMPLPLRERILKDLKFDYCLIAFQANFDGINNLEYFDNFKKLYKDIDFRVVSIDHLPGHFYLYGKLKK